MCSNAHVFLFRLRLDLRISECTTTGTENVVYKLCCDHICTCLNVCCVFSVRVAMHLGTHRCDRSLNSKAMPAGCLLIMWQSACSVQVTTHSEIHRWEMKLNGGCQMCVLLCAKHATNAPKCVTLCDQKGSWATLRCLLCIGLSIQVNGLPYVWCAFRSEKAQEMWAGTCVSITLRCEWDVMGGWYWAVRMTREEGWGGNKGSYKVTFLSIVMGLLGDNIEVYGDKSHWKSYKSSAGMNFYVAATWVMEMKTHWLKYMGCNFEVPSHMTNGIGEIRGLECVAPESQADKALICTGPSSYLHLIKVYV